MDVQDPCLSLTGTLNDSKKATWWKLKYEERSFLHLSSSAGIDLQSKSRGPLNDKNESSMTSSPPSPKNLGEAIESSDDLVSIGLETAASADSTSDLPKIERPVKLNLRKKSKKKRKQFNRLTLFSLEKGSTQSKSCRFSRNMHPSENIGLNRIVTGTPDLEENLNDSCNELTNSCSSPSSCISHSDGVDQLEGPASMPQKFPVEHVIGDQSQVNEISASASNNSTMLQTLDPCQATTDDEWSCGPTANGSISLESPHLKEDCRSNCSDSGTAFDYSSYDTSLDTGNQLVLDEISHNSVSEVSKTTNGHWSMMTSYTASMDGAEAGSQECSSSDTCPSKSGRRDGQSKKLFGRSRKLKNQSRSPSTHGYLGKENNHSVWQRVQKNNSDKGIGVVKNDISSTLKEAFLGKSITFEEAPMQKDQFELVSGALGSDLSLSKIEYEFPTNNTSEVRRRHTSFSRQEHKPHVRKAQSSGKISSIRPILTIVQHKESFEKFNQRACASSKDQADCSLLVLPNSASSLDDKRMPGNNVSPSPKVTSDGGFDFSQVNECERPEKLESKAVSLESGRSDESYSSLSWKWVPVGRKNDWITTSSSDDTGLTSNVDKNVSGCLDLKDFIEENFNSLQNLKVVCVGSSSVKLKSSTTGNNGRESSDLEYQTPNLVSLNPFSEERKDEGVRFETDVHKMLQVVRDAYRSQVDCENVQLATGGPLAEFERFLYSASPIVSDIQKHPGCCTFFADRFVGDSLCKHQVPNVSLASLWQWYEKHGSYGLEVKAVDIQKSKKFRHNCPEFQAYFVPSLSAVQLFGKARNRVCSAAMAESWVDASLENSSEPSLLSIFSKLVPQPQKDESPSSGMPMNDECSSVLSCSSSAALRFDDLELLFEYFEYELPQQRRPLFEKIRELVRGEVTSNCKVFGDAQNLERLHLHDLHPSSWYSVAWYPIYRIPDGPFRVAFLTYHSLGHFIQRRAPPNSLGEEACAVSPVVGLQSYNAQNECWFEPRNMTIPPVEEMSSLIPSDVLKERLRTLEQTASVMARATVWKENQKSVNRQPDYEFFLSRKW